MWPAQRSVRTLFSPPTLQRVARTEWPIITQTRNSATNLKAKSWLGSRASERAPNGDIRRPMGASHADSQ